MNKLKDVYQKIKKVESRHLLLAASIIMFIVIVTGGVLQSTDPAGVCGHWLSCIGVPLRLSSGIEISSFLHGLSTLVLTLMTIAAALWVWKSAHDSIWLRKGMILLMAILTFEIILGGVLAINSRIPFSGWMSALHLVLALSAQGILLTATVRTMLKNEGHDFRILSRFGHLSLLTLVSVSVLLVSGMVIAPAGATESCLSWPLCVPGTFTGDIYGWIQLIHRMAVVVTSILMIVLLVDAWRTQRNKTAVLLSSTAAAVLYAAQALLGAKLVDGFPAYMVVLHQATAAAIWGVLVILVAIISFTEHLVKMPGNAVEALPQRKGLIKDMLLLTKPIVVALLLVTTIAGMVIGAQEWPAFKLAFWTLIGGFMAAGGSGAINQYIDREDDRKMQRTQKRPIPSGRLTPAEGLAFGVAMTLASFYLMVAFVNWLAAVLCLAGIIYYVLIYSILLKKTTVQNIVIGGGAGAIPPLVGWAAATGSLNIPSLFLFAVIFMWTPPHFWALALVRQNDYARAGVPMLPVMRGAVETRWQILIYTIGLVGMTLLLPLFGLGGAVYMVGAAILGLWLLAAAWRVWKLGGNKLAWKMYRYSSMYLAFLFLVLMVDRLL